MAGILWDLFKQIKLGKLIINSTEKKHACGFWEFDDFKLFFNTTHSKILSEFKLNCCTTHGIKEIEAFSPPHIISDMYAKARLVYDPRYVYLQFLMATEREDYRSEQALEYKLKMIKGFINSIHSKEINSVVLMQDPNYFIADTCFMSFKGGLFGQLDASKKLLENWKYFDSNSFKNFMDIVSNHGNMIIDEIDVTLTTLELKGIEGVIDNLNPHFVGDDNLKILIRNVDVIL